MEEAIYPVYIIIYVTVYTISAVIGSFGNISVKKLIILFNKSNQIFIN